MPTKSRTLSPAEFEEMATVLPRIFERGQRAQFRNTLADLGRADALAMVARMVGTASPETASALVRFLETVR